MAEKARLQALQVVEAPLAPEAHGVAAGARRRRGRALRGPGQFLLGQLPCRARVSRLLVDRHGNSLAHRRATPLEEIALRESPRTDRKSGGSGKRGSVRVESGGRRIIKKKKNK